MFSNLVITQNKFVLFIDNVGFEKFSTKFITEWLSEQSQYENTLFLNNINIDNYNLIAITKKYQIELLKTDQKLNIVLPSLLNTLTKENCSIIFQLVNFFKNQSQIKQIFLWATTKNISEHFIISFLEYMADLTVTFKDLNYLSILNRKMGGLVSNKNYLYTTKECKFLIEHINTVNNIQKVDVNAKPQDFGTFKIDLDEEELIARNALKLPYERTSNELKEGNIIYTPDADDDFDDEDPDEDLYI